MASPAAAMPSSPTKRPKTLTSKRSHQLLAPEATMSTPPASPTTKLARLGLSSSNSMNDDDQDAASPSFGSLGLRGLHFEAESSRGASAEQSKQSTRAMDGDARASLNAHARSSGGDEVGGTLPTAVGTLGTLFSKLWQEEGARSPPPFPSSQNSGETGGTRPGWGTMWGFTGEAPTRKANISSPLPQRLGDRDGAEDLGMSRNMAAAAAAAQAQSSRKGKTRAAIPFNTASPQPSTSTPSPHESPAFRSVDTSPTDSTKLPSSSSFSPSFDITKGAYDSASTSYDGEMISAVASQSTIHSNSSNGGNDESRVPPSPTPTPAAAKLASTRAPREDAYATLSRLQIRPSRGEMSEGQASGQLKPAERQHQQLLLPHRSSDRWFAVPLWWESRQLRGHSPPGRV